MLGKKFTKNLLALLAVMTLASCGESVTPSASSSAPAASSSSAGDGKTTIKFWHTMGKTNQDILKSMIKEFNKTYPDIVIEETAASGSYEDLQSLILSNVATGNLPTMAFCYPDNVAEYLDKGCVVNMSSYVDDPEVGFTEAEGKSTDGEGGVRIGKADYVKAFWDEGTEYASEGVYSVPFAKSTEALFYNKTAFDRYHWDVPETWDEMWELCETIRAQFPQTDDEGNYVYTPLGYDSDSNFFITMAKQLGYDYTTNDLVNHDSHFIFNNDGIKSMLSDLKSKYDAGLFKTKNTSANSTYTSSKFTAGEIFMSIGSTGGTSYNATQNFTVGVAVPPSVDKDQPAVISQGPSICFFNRATKAETKAAWLFYKFISNATNSCLYGLQTGYQPVRYSSYLTSNYMDYITDGDPEDLMVKVASVSSSMFDSYFSSPVFVGSALARTEVGKALGTVLIGTKTIDKALDDATSNCVNGTRA